MSTSLSGPLGRVYVAQHRYPLTRRIAAAFSRRVLRWYGVG